MPEPVEGSFRYSAGYQSLIASLENKDTRAKQRAIKHTHSWPKIHEYETLASGKIGIDFVGPTCFENLENPFILELLYDSCASAAVEASSERILCSLCKPVDMSFPNLM